MSAHRKPPYRRRRLGRRLRALRESAGLSMDDAAAKLDKSRTSLFRIESGENKADTHLVRSMMDIYDIWEDGLLEEVREATRPRWFSAYGLKDMGYVDLETEACRIREYGGLHLPGLLQTEAYLRALFERAWRRRRSEHVDNQVEVRLIRQKRLASQNPPLDLVAIIDEAVLRRVVGNRKVMHAQLRHLAEFAALPAITLQVSPLDGGAHSAMDGAFILLDFPDSDEEMLYHAYVSGSLHIEDQEEVREAKLVFDALRSEALNPIDSVALIEQLATLLYLP